MDSLVTVFDIFHSSTCDISKASIMQLQSAGPEPQTAPLLQTEAAQNTQNSP